MNTPLTIKQISPTKIPFKCPTCNGFGSLKYGKLQCHACRGQGYVVIDQKTTIKDRQTVCQTHNSLPI